MNKSKCLWQFSTCIVHTGFVCRSESALIQLTVSLNRKKSKLSFGMYIAFEWNKKKKDY